MKQLNIVLNRERSGGFTLVEMLVVMFIIAVLISIALPMIGEGRRRARFVQTLQQVKDIKNAVDQYYAEYARLPVPPNTTSDYTAEDDKSRAVILALTGHDDDSSASGIRNKRYFTFLEGEGIETDGEYLDVYGNQFLIMMDADYDGQLEYIIDQDLRVAVVVASYGPDGSRQTDAGGDDIISYVSVSQ